MPDLLDGEALAEFREILLCLVRPKIPCDLRGRIDPSDVVQETLVDALRDLGGRRGRTRAEMVGWLGRILQFNLADRFRRLRLEPRAISSLGGDWFERSSGGLFEFSRLGRSDPLEKAIGREEAAEAAVLVAGMLARLSEAQSEAIVLKHSEGMRVEEIARHMNRTPESVGGLLRHGMRRLRELNPGRGD